MYNRKNKSINNNGQRNRQFTNINEQKTIKNQNATKHNFKKNRQVTNIHFKITTNNKTNNNGETTYN